VAGEHRVAVSQMVVADGAASHVRSHHATMVIHPRFGRFETSGLTRRVEPDQANEFVIEVEPAAAQRGW
jgi:hypothetical protein